MLSRDPHHYSELESEVIILYYLFVISLYSILSY